MKKWINCWLGTDSCTSINRRHDRLAIRASLQKA